MAELYVNNAYNSLYPVRQIPYKMIDYLFKNNTELWKLLYYSQSTLNQPLVSDTIKANMIANTSTGDLSKYQVFFQQYTTDATLSGDAQIRIEVVRVEMPNNRTDALVKILVQCIANNKAQVIATDKSPIDHRGFAMAQSIVESLNGTQLEGVKSQLFIDGSIDRQTGVYKTSFGDNFSGYEIIIDCWV
ncbi:MAG: hypothetical protein WCO84_01535 [bacterium]